MCSFIKLCTAHTFSMPILLEKNQPHLQYLLYQTESNAEYAVYLIIYIYFKWIKYM